MAIPHKFKITLGICRSDDTPIFFKKDGGRFEKENTLKLQVDVQYDFTLSIKPSVPLQGISLQGIGLTLTDNSQDNQQVGSGYAFSFNTSKMERNKNRDRSQLLLQLQFQDGVCMRTPLQVKFYNKDDTQHVNWGRRLNQLEFECEVKPGNTHVDIAKEVFL